MDHDLWVRGADAIDNASVVLLVKKRSLPDIDTNVHLRGTNMIKRRADIFLLFVDQWLKIDVN